MPNFTIPRPVNPAAGGGFQPSGPSSAGAWEQDRSRYLDMAQVEDKLSRLGAQDAAMGYSERAQLAPERMASERATLQQAPQTLEKMTRDNRMGNATESSDIRSKISGNATTVAQNNVKQSEAGIETLNMAQAALNNAESPMAAQKIYDDLLQQIPPQLRQRLPKHYSPQVSQMLEGLTKAAMNNLAQQRKMAEQEAKDKAAMARQRVSSNAQIQSARIGQEGKNKSPEQLAREAKQLEEIWIKTASIIEDPKADNSTKEWAKNLRESVRPAYEEQLRKSGMMIHQDGTIGPMPKPNLGGTPAPSGASGKTTSWNDLPK